MGQAKQRGTLATRQLSAIERHAEQDAERQERFLQWEAEQSRIKAEAEEASAKRLAIARSVKPKDFHSGVSQHGVFEAMIDALMKAGKK